MMKVYLLHGIATNKDSLDQELYGLSEAVQKVFIDLNKLTYACNSIDEVLASLRNKINHNEKYILLGHSFGATITCLYGKKYSEDPNLVGIISCYDPSVLLWKGLKPIPRILMSIVRFIPAFVFRFFASSYCPIKVLSFNMKGVSRNTLQKQLSWIESTKTEYPSNIPLLIIYGLSDKFLNLNNYEEVRKRNLPNAQIELIHKAGHFGVEKGRKTMVDTINIFINKNLRSSL